MQLDLTKFEALAKEAEPEVRSSTHIELNKAFTVIYSCVERGLKQKQIVEMLAHSGMDKLNIALFSSWWNSNPVKRRRDDYEKEREAIAAKQKAEVAKRERVSSSMVNDALAGAAASKTSESTAKKTSAPTPSTESPAVARHRRASIPGRTKTPTSEPNIVEGDMLIPWTSFTDNVKHEHDWGTQDLSLALQELGLVKRQDRSYVMTEDGTHYLIGVAANKAIVFSKIKVRMQSLLAKINEYVESLHEA